MDASNGTASFALSMNSLDSIRSKAGKAPDAALKQAAQVFEGLILQRMLHSMRQSVPDSGVLSSDKMKMYRGLLDKQLAQSMAQRDIGLAEIMVRQLQGTQSSGDEGAGRDDNQVDRRVAGVQTADPKPLGPSQAIAHNHLSQQRTQTDGSLFGSGATRAPLVNQMTLAKVNAADSDLPGYARHFLDKLSEPAERVARETGISPRLILAQAALETGWGQHTQSAYDGTTTFNIFNIKAGGWQGETTHAKTFEFLNGQMQTVQAEFRVYNSYQEAFRDYADLIGHSPRYQAVAAAPDVEEAAERLQEAGYATDPHYARKLKAIMSQIAVDNTAGIDSLVNQDTSSLVDLYSAMSSDNSGAPPERGVIGVG